MNSRAKSDRDESVTLEILNEVATRSDLTQRHLADRLGVALGLANSYLKRCVRKGYVKIQQAPANRYMYYLTPQGLAEKSRLTAQYLAFSFDFYRRASADMVSVAEACCAAGVRRVLFAGASELAEIGSIRCQDAGLELVGTFDPDCSLTRFVGRPVWRRLADCAATEVVIYTALVPDPPLYTALAERFGERLLIPELVRPLVGDRYQSSAHEPVPVDPPVVAGEPAGTSRESTG